MATTYAQTQIQDGLTKLNLYLNSLLTHSSPDKCEKIVHLSTQLFLKFMENQQFAKESYERVKSLIHTKNNYYALLIFDQMLKNNKVTFKYGKRDCQNLFKGVWEKTWNQNKESSKIQNLKLMVKVWGYIYGSKYEENIRKWVEAFFKCKLNISQQKQAELKQIYGLAEPPKTDLKMQELMNKMDVEENPKKSQIKEQSLLQALGIDNI